MLAVIAVAKILFEVFLLPNQFAEIAEIRITQFPQLVGNRLWIANFRSNEPERINKGKADKFVPLLAQIPKMKLPFMLLPEMNCLVANEKAGAFFRDGRVR